MAINDTTQGINIEPDNSSAMPKSSWDFNSGIMFGAPIPKTVYNEYYTKVKDGLFEIYKHTNKDVEISLMDLDNINNPGLAYSSIVVICRYTTHKNKLAYHILTLEATGEKIQPAYENMNGIQIEVLRFACNAIDEVLRNKAEEKVRKNFPNVDLYYAEGTVVPPEFNPEDKLKMHKLALNAGLACTTELNVQNVSFTDLNLQQLPKDNSLFINVDFNRQQVEDSVGNTMRSDVTVNFGTRKQQVANSRSVNTGDRDNNIALASGFIDLLWAPINPQSLFNPYVAQQPQQTQKYAARLVVTNLVTNFGYTPAMVLLALATAVSVRDNNTWINTFRPSPIDGGSIDLRDVGALNIESNLENDPSGFGKRIDTKSESFQLSDLGQLISALVRPGLVISLDCPEAGPQSWYLSMFAAAARGSEAASNVILAAANQLTNQRFNQYFNKGQMIFADVCNTIHLGYWIDRKGQKRDLRDIDTLAVCNIAGERNPELIRGYSDTFLRKDIPAVKRLADRKRIIQALTNESAVFTGYAERVTFNSSFVNALVQGIAETGVSVRTNAQVLDDINAQRGYAEFINDAILTGNQTFMNYNTYNAVQNPWTGYQGHRW